MDRRVVGLLLALALVVRLGYVAATPDYNAVNDAHNYDVHARSSRPATALPESARGRVARRRSGRPATPTSSRASMR